MGDLISDPHLFSLLEMIYMRCNIRIQNKYLKKYVSQLTLALSWSELGTKQATDSNVRGILICEILNENLKWMK